jgi:hypothetical protein
LLGISRDFKGRLAEVSFIPTIFVLVRKLQNIEACP